VTSAEKGEWNIMLLESVEGMSTRRANCRLRQFRDRFIREQQGSHDGGIIPGRQIGSRASGARESRVENIGSLIVLDLEHFHQSLTDPWGVPWSDIVLGRLHLILVGEARMERWKGSPD
jgi:hypothetical protein